MQVSSSLSHRTSYIHTNFLNIFTYIQDLIDVTYTTHYANYRANHLTEVMQAAGFSLQDGRDPLSQLDAERRLHQVKLDKLVEEMNQVYVEKV